MDSAALQARPGIMKCAGADLPSCSRCTRKLAPAAETNQRWVEPLIKDGACWYAADIETYALFYLPLADEEGPGHA